MQDTKIFFTDLDDTLLDSQKKVSPENQAAIHEALDAGHRIVINTGRPLPAALPLIRRTGLNRPGCYAITYNGGLIYDCGSGETLFKKTLTMEDVRYIFQEAAKAGLYAHTYDSRNLICPRCTGETLRYCANSEIDWKEDPDFLEHLEEAPVKIIVIDFEDHQRLEDFRRSLAPWAKGRVSVSFSNAFYLEHVADGISKGGAMHFLCDRLGIPISRSVAAGDAENDIPMLQTAGLGAAVANASPETKKAADYVAERDCNHSAVAEIIRKFVTGAGM